MSDDDLPLDVPKKHSPRSSSERNGANSGHTASACSNRRADAGAAATDAPGSKIRSIKFQFYSDELQLMFQEVVNNNKRMYKIQT